MATAEQVLEYMRVQNLPHIWCPGCSNGITTRAIVKAIIEAGVDRDKTVIVSGIGCSSRTAGYLDFDTVHTTHGRPLAFATGIKLARPELTVIVIAGDGDTAAIGGNHLIHAARRNIDITMVCYNNNIYGMTGGQYSPTTHPGNRATTAPYGHVEREFDLCELARAAGATFVARGTAYHFQPLVQYLTHAIKHRGFAFVEVLNTCPVYFGRQNGIPRAPELLEWVAAHAVTAKQAERLTPVERIGKYVIGELHHAEAPEFTEEYMRVVKAAQERAAVRPEQVSGAGRAATLPLRRVEVRLAGTGGQGQVLAAIILAEAAGIYEGRNVVQSQDYGPESRGGASKAEVIITDEAEVDYPKVTQPDVLLAMSQDAFAKYAPSVRGGGMIIADSGWVHGDGAPAGVNLYRLPLTDIAREETGRALAANVVALGAIAALAGVVSLEALEKAVLARVPRGTEEINRRALLAGYRAGRELKEGDR